MSLNGNQVKYTSVDTEKKPENQRCGISRFRPNFLQMFAHPLVFTIHTTVGLIAYINAAAYFNGVLTTIERNFQLDSSQSGALTIVNDVLSLSCQMFAAYFGNRSHRPRWIASGLIISGLGTIICSFPHYLSDPLDVDVILYGTPTQRHQDLCTNASTFFGNGTGEACEKQSDGMQQVWLLIVGQILVGIGYSTQYALTITYIDDAVPKHSVVMYTAIYFCGYAVGPATGYFLSSWTTSLYVDFDRVEPDLIPNISQRDPKWIGAWWLGFLIMGAVMIIIAIPMFLYPNHLAKRTSKGEYEDMKDSKNGIENHDLMMKENGHKTMQGNAKKNETTSDMLKDIAKTMGRIVTNPVVIFLNCFAVFIGSGIAVFATFSAKYIQTQFSISPKFASTILGFSLLAKVLGQAASAAICRKFKLTPSKCAVFCIFATIFGLIIYPTQMFFGCETQPIAGVTEFSGAGLPESASYDQFGCYGTDCECSTEAFSPVCGMNNITYISPCHAGCSRVEAVPNPLTGRPTQNFYDCQCTWDSMNSTVDTSYSTSKIEATSGFCENNCPSQNLTIYVVLIVVGVLIASMKQNPITFIFLRSVREEDRSVALGLQLVLGRLLAWFPAPIYSGALINSACILWQYTCGERGACWIYDLKDFRYKFFGLISMLQLGSFFCLIGVYLALKCTKVKKMPTDEVRKV